MHNSALVENCELLEICTTHMRLIITNCSGTIEMTLAICYKNNEKQCGEEVILIIKHEYSDFKGIDSENIFNPFSLENK